MFHILFIDNMKININNIKFSWDMHNFRIPKKDLNIFSTVRKTAKLAFTENWKCQYFPPLRASYSANILQKITLNKKSSWGHERRYEITSITRITILSIQCFHVTSKRGDQETEPIWKGKLNTGKWEKMWKSGKFTQTSLDNLRSKNSLTHEKRNFNLKLLAPGFEVHTIIWW